MTHRSRRRRLIPLVGFSVACLALTLVQSASAATKTPVSFTVASVDPATADGGAYNFDIGFAGADDAANGFVKGRKAGHCIENGIAEADIDNATLRTGNPGADLSLQAGSLAAAPGGRNRLEWLLLSSARSRVATTGAQRDFEAAAHQLAIWLLTTPPGGSSVTANDAAALARANVLLADSATHGPAVATAAALAVIGSQACGQTTRTVRVTGAPLTDVTLTIAGGQAAFTTGVVAAGGQSTIVTLGPGGTADVGVSSTAIGTVRIVGAFTAQTLVQVDAGVHQDFAYLEPRTATAEVVLDFTACPPPQPPAPPAPPGPPSVPPAPPPIIDTTGITSTRLTVSKTAPRRTLAGSVIVYRIVVRNATAVEASDVRMSDILPAGTAVVSGPRGSRVSKGRLSWDVGTLAAGASRGFRVVLRVDRRVRTSRCNTVEARAGNAPTTRARTCTIVVAGAVSIPAVTG